MLRRLLYVTLCISTSPDFNCTWHIASLGKGDQNVCSNEGSHSFPAGCDYEITKLHYLKIFVPRTRKPSSPEVLGTFQPNLAGSTLRCCSNERTHPFPSGNYNEIVKIKNRFLQNQKANINSNWNKAFLGDGVSNLFI